MENSDVYFYNFSDSSEKTDMNLKKQKRIITKKVLKKALGWTWFLFLIMCDLRAKKMFRHSSWGRHPNAEANFVRPFALAAVIYIKLKKKFNENSAFLIMQHIIVPLDCMRQSALLAKAMVSDADPMKKLHAFNRILDRKGAIRFNDIEYIRKDDQVCHFKVRRCVYKDFFDYFQAPELTGLFCEKDREFFQAAFADLKVHRAGSWENTLGFGRRECDFVFERHSPSVLA